MCGIFGYVGPRASTGLLLESLKRLEYRGYDSWGMAMACGDRLQVFRQVGRITGAEAPKLDSGLQPCWGGIAHTRWATHGAPTVGNAHPHTDCHGEVAIVHNGIIENHSALRAELESHGHVFRSQTDTEVIAHLIEELLKQENDFQSAFLGALKLLEGTYGIAAISPRQPGLILAARHGSPMVLGLGKDEMMVASDPSALVAHTRRVVYLEDGEAAALRADGFKTHDLNATPIAKTVQQIAFDLPAIERGGYAHFMLKEIFEQPDTIRNAFRGRIVNSEGAAKLGGVDERNCCGRRSAATSSPAAPRGMRAWSGNTFWRESRPHPDRGQLRGGVPLRQSRGGAGHTMVIAISQSGETHDTLAGVREAMLRGASAIGICNVVGSTIARECGQGVYIHAGPEIGVASTKAFTGQIAVLALLAIHMGRLRGMSLAEGIQFLDAIERLPDQARAALACDGQIREIAAEYADCPNFLYIGRLYEYPVAREGDAELPRLAERTIFVPSTLDPLVPILAVIPLQLLAYHIAVRRGCDVDRPRNLAKSVTVE
jgi:glucosamine--fructose-6-phosphate aminotransferase (isomerizing)